jgi:hypothetical protein
MDDRQAKRALVERGLERAGDAIGDITAPLMERFYAAFPDAEASFIIMALAAARCWRQRWWAMSPIA